MGNIAAERRSDTVTSLTREEIEDVFAALEGIERHTSPSDTFREDGFVEQLDDSDEFDESHDEDDDDDEAPAATRLPVDGDAELPAAPGLLERIAGLVALASFTAVGVMLQGVRPDALFQVTAIAVVTAIALGGLVASHGPRMLVRLFGVCLGMQAVDEGEARALHTMCEHGRRLAYTGAAVQLLASAVFWLESGQPGLSGHAVGTALTGVLFGLLLAEVGFGSVRHWIRTCLY